MRGLLVPMQLSLENISRALAPPRPRPARTALHNLTRMLLAEHDDLHDSVFQCICIYIYTNMHGAACAIPSRCSITRSARFTPVA